MKFNYLEKLNKNEDVMRKINEVVSGKISVKLKKKIEDGKLDKFTLTDWKEYFKCVARESNPCYLSRWSSNYKNSIIKSLLEDYKPEELKAMIDFIWSEEFKEVPKDRIDWWVLKKENIDTIYQMSQKNISSIRNSSKKMESDWN